MLRRIRIEKFRGFDKLDTELSQINVLLGPNSCGKTSVLQAVRLACSALTWVLSQGPSPKLDGDWIRVWWDWPVRPEEAFLPAMPTWDLFLNQSGSQLVIGLEFDDSDFIQQLQVSMRYGRSEALRLDVRVKSEGALSAVSGLKPKSSRLSPALAEALSGKEPIAVTIPAFYGVVKEEPYVNDAQLERRLSAGDQGRAVRNLISRLPNLKQLNDFMQLSVHAEFTVSTSGQDLQKVEHLTTHYRDTNGGLELSSAGTGLVALAALYSALAWYAPRKSRGRPLLFLLDEPEAHLHPKLQSDTGERIAELLAQFGAQALIATHSVEMINRLGRRADTQLLSVDRSAKEPTVRLTTENDVVKRLESFCNLSPFASLNLLRTRRVLFHEGKTDRAVLERCAEALFANDPARLDRFKQWTFVELSSETNADAKDVFKKALEPLIAAEKGTDLFRIVRVLDRDYHRSPMLLAEDDQGAIRQLNVVWSRYSIESLFLDPSCLAAWLALHLKAYPGAPSLSELEAIVQRAIETTNGDLALIDHAVDQMLARALRKLTLGEMNSTKAILAAKKEIEAKIKAEPAVYQHGKKRASCILAHIRTALPKELKNRIRSDVPEILQYAPSPSALISPALIPAEIHTLLQYLVS